MWEGFSPPGHVTLAPVGCLLRIDVVVRGDQLKPAKETRAMGLRLLIDGPKVRPPSCEYTQASNKSVFSQTLRGTSLLAGQFEVMDGEEGELRSARYTNLVKNVAHVPLDRLLADAELVGDFLVAGGGDDERRDLQFTVGKPEIRRRHGPPRPPRQWAENGHQIPNGV